MRKMKDMEFAQTRWADHQLLRDLGLFDEVSVMFTNMGLAGLFNMAHIAHEEETKQFLATLSFYDDTALDITDENRGRLSFKIHGKVHELTMVQLGSIFNFPTGGEVYSLKLDMNEAQGVWTLIAKGEYKKGVSKATNLKHPAIRYAHKFLAHTLFARRETGNVKEEELALLTEGIKPFLRTTATGDEIIGQPQPLNLAHYLAYRFLYYQDWVTSNKDKTPQLGIGGLITPILRACGAEIRPVEETIPIMRIDAPYLATTHFLVGRIKRSYGYRFHLGTEKKIIILPNQGATNFAERDNLLFTPKVWLLHDPSKDGHLTSLRGNRAKSQGQDDDEELPEEVYGSKRYDFEPYAEPISGNALKAAHEHISLLRRLAKWQGKQIKKLVKTVKKQGKLIKTLLKDSSSPTRRTEEGGSSMAMVIGETQTDDAEPSTHGGRQRRDKGKAPLSPSSSGSGNLSYSMDSSSPSPSY